MAKVLVFDLDGVIIDSRRMYVELLSQALDECKIHVPFDVIDERLIPNIKDTIETVVPRHVKDRELWVLKAEAQVVKLTAAEGLNYISLNPKAEDTLKKLKNKNNKLYLLSNSHSGFIDKLLAKYELKSYFEEVIPLDGGYSTKDDAIIHISETEKLEPSEILYIGDTEKDVELANRIGCKCIIVFSKISWQYPNKQKIMKLEPESIIDNLPELVQVVDMIK